MRFLHLFAMVLLASSLAAARDHGPVALEAEIDVLTFNQFWSALGMGSYATVYAPSCEMGIRVMPADNFGLDLLAGFVLQTGVERDSASGTSEQPSGLSFSFSAGLVPVIARGDRGQLALLVRGGTVIQKQYDYDYSGMGGEDKFADWISVSPRFFVGFEPSVYFGDNVSLFSNFGLAGVVFPNSKYIDTMDPSYDFDAGVLPLKQRKDRYFVLLVDGLCIGLRYFF
ncbi:MAG: hypothetical protein GF418_15540 [Chitinivibrionales bacterium]|nr:hypothetical protein [Chitinivibrionales bacterium]MBD3397034.1 hypothetical protein [Chitinivibrionales bacterium]